jgi:hypothetical protein
VHFLPLSNTNGTMAFFEIYALLLFNSCLNIVCLNIVCLNIVCLNIVCLIIVCLIIYGFTVDGLLNNMPFPMFNCKHSQKYESRNMERHLCVHFVILENDILRKL